MKKNEAWKQGVGGKEVLRYEAWKEEGADAIWGVIQGQQGGGGKDCDLDLVVGGDLHGGKAIKEGKRRCRPHR